MRGQPNNYGNFSLIIANGATKSLPHGKIYIFLRPQPISVKMRIAVYCSSKDGISAAYQRDAEEIGHCVASLGCTMVYGGLNLGMMRIAADAAKAAGGRIVGIVPIKRKDVINPANDENVLALDLNDRKAKMELMSDIFVVLPGGYGTLDEWISTFSFLTFTSDMHKPIIVLNHGGLYDPTLRQMQLMVEHSLLDPKQLDRIKVARNADECCAMIKNELKNQN